MKRSNTSSPLQQIGGCEEQQSAINMFKKLIRLSPRPDGLEGAQERDVYP